jgi:signal transduction histidine kinase
MADLTRNFGALAVGASADRVMTALAEPRAHPRKIGWLGTSALAMGGSNQSLFLINILIAGQGDIPGQGTAAIPLLVVGLILSWFALPGWTELIMMWPDRVGGIAATCGEAFRPYAPVLGNLTGVSYWWGWIPTCGLTALFSASAISQWFLPGVPVPLLACLIVAVFVVINLLGVRWAANTAIAIAAVAAALAFLSAIIPVISGTVDWQQAASFHLDTPFDGPFGAITSAMAGLYLIGFAAPAFEAAACHVGETINPTVNVPRAMYASAGMATLYFLALPVIWLGVIGPKGLSTDLAVSLGPTFAPLFGALGKSAAIGFMMFNMFHGTLAPLTGVARTLSQLSEDGLLPELFARRTRSDCPWVAIVLTAGAAIGFLLIGDPVWLVAAANFTYLIGIALPSVAVWLLRRDQPAMPRPYRAPRGTVTLGLLAAICWGVATIVGFQQYGLPTVILGLVLAYSGAGLYGWRKWMDRRKAGLGGVGRSLHLKLTGAMLLVLALDGAGYYLAVHSVTIQEGHTQLVTGLEDIFVAVAILTITVGLVLPGMIAHSAVEVSRAADRLAVGTMADFSRAMTALAGGDLDGASARVDFAPVVARSRDEVGEMARSFNTLQQEIAKAAIGLSGAREGLRRARDELTETNINLEIRVVARTRELEAAHKKLLVAARHAGMAEVAIGILHNIGNVLNSVNISVTLIDQVLRPSQSKAKNLTRLAELLDDETSELGRVARQDLRGRQIIEYLRKYARHAELERDEVLGELDSLIRSIDHIKQIVSSQQSLPRGASLIEAFDVLEVTDEALRINMTKIEQHGIVVERRFSALPTVVADKHLLLQVLVNLISNAVRAVAESTGEAHTITITVGRDPTDPARVTWQIDDTGIGICADHMTRIFESGFTTKTTEQGGFGLHSSALSAERMAGSLHAHSDGVGKGARFVLEFPLHPAEPDPEQASVAS